MASTSPVGADRGMTDTPSVEKRLHTIERALALATFVTRTIGIQTDLFLGDEDRDLVLNLTSDLCEDALADVRAIEEGIPRPTLFLKIPDLSPEGAS